MANYTFSVDTNLCDFIDTTSAYDSADNIFVNSGAVLTIDRSPASALGTITIDDGNLLVDGANATSPIHIWGRGGKHIAPAGSSGVFTSTEGWYIHSTTGTGLASQTLDMTDYWEGNAGVGDFTDVINGLWMEDTVEVSFGTVTGSGTPAQYDWVEDVSDNTIFGRVMAYDASAGTIQIEGWPQTLASGTTLRVVKEIDDEGPQYREVWRATTTSAESLVTDKWMKMVNLTLVGDSIPTRLDAKSGQGFTNLQFSNTINFPFKVPRSGARFRFNMITIGNVTDEAGFDAQTPAWVVAETNRYDFSGSNAGTANCVGINFGSACGASSAMGTWTYSKCATSQYGGNGLGTQMLLTDCIMSPDYSDASIKGGRLNALDTLAGAKLTDCLIFGDASGGQQKVLFQNNNNVEIERCSMIVDWDPTDNPLTLHLVTVKECTIKNNEIYGNVILSKVTNFEMVNNRINTSPLQNPDEMQNNSSRSITVSQGSDNGLIKGVLSDAIGTKELVYVVDSFGLKIRCLGSPDKEVPLSSSREAALITVGGAYDDVDVARVYTGQTTTTTTNGKKVITNGRTGNKCVMTNIHSNYNGEIEPGGNLYAWKGVTGAEGGGLNRADGVEVDVVNTYGNMVFDFFGSTTVGGIAFMWREPSALDGSDQLVTFTGDYYFDRKGKLGLYDGSSLEYVMPYFAKGHTGLNGDITCGTSNATDGGSNALSATITLEFQYDLNDGNGYNGTWLDADTAANLTGVTIDPDDGIKLKWRLSNNSGVLKEFNGLIFGTSTTAADQEALYPIDQNFVGFSLTGLQTNSEVRVYLTGTTTELFGVENSTATFSNQYLHTGTDFGVDIVVHNEQYEYIRLENITLTATAVSIPIQQQFDRQYNNP